MLRDLSFRILTQIGLVTKSALAWAGAAAAAHGAPVAIAQAPANAIETTILLLDMLLPFPFRRRRGQLTRSRPAAYFRLEATGLTVFDARPPAPAGRRSRRPTLSAAAARETVRCAAPALPCHGLETKPSPSVGVSRAGDFGWVGVCTGNRDSPQLQRRRAGGAGPAWPVVAFSGYTPCLKSVARKQIWAYNRSAPVPDGP